MGRLGYPCRWEMMMTEEADRACKLCSALNTSLQHHLVDYEQTTYLRTGPTATPTAIVHRLCNSLTKGKLLWLANHEPPRKRKEKKEALLGQLMTDLCVYLRS